MTTDTKVEFGSTGWKSAFQAILEELVAESGDGETVYSMSEEYTDAPAQISDDGIGGFCFRIDKGEVTFEHEPATDVDFKIVADYASIIPIARFNVAETAGGEQTMQTLVADLIRSGKLTTTGDRDKSPAYLSPIHDRLAAITS